jgi:hypothetical protein
MLRRMYSGTMGGNTTDDMMMRLTDNGTAAVAEEADGGSKLWSIIYQIQSSLLYLTHS